MSQLAEILYQISPQQRRTEALQSEGFTAISQSQIPQEKDFSFWDLTKNWQLSSMGPQPHHPAQRLHQLDSQSRLQGHLKNTRGKEDLVGVSGSFLAAARFLHLFCAQSEEMGEGLG